MRLLIVILLIVCFGCGGTNKSAINSNVKSRVEWRKQGDTLFLKQDTLRALECWREAASLNDSIAKYYLSLCYMEGCGVLRDSNQAIEYCIQSGETRISGSCNLHLEVVILKGKW